MQHADLEGTDVAMTGRHALCIPHPSLLRGPTWSDNSMIPITYKNDPVTCLRSIVSPACGWWPLGLLIAALASHASLVHAEELQQPLLTTLSSTTLSGYVDTSAIWKLGSDDPQGRTLPGRTFDGPDRQDGFNLEVVKLTLEKPLQEGIWSAGYKADLVFGPNGNYYGTILNGGSAESLNDFNVKQAYAALRAPVGNGLDFKVGVFDTIIGYEVFESANNPNYSRSYGYALEPSHHIGVLANYQFTSWLGVAAGVANTYTGFINARPQRGGEAAVESEKAYLGSITITLPNTGFLAGSALYAGVVDGLNGAAANLTSQDITSYYVGGSVATPIKGLAVGAAYDYRQDGPTLTGASLPDNNRAYAVAGYLTYAVTEKFKVAARLDYVNADNGTFYGEPGSGAIYEVRHTASHEKLLGSTLTLDYSLWENVVTRLEARWDHSLTGDRPYGNANEKNAVSLAANVVYKF